MEMPRTPDSSARRLTFKVERRTELDRSQGRYPAAAAAALHF